MRTESTESVATWVAVGAIALVLLLAVFPPWLSVVQRLQTGPVVGLDNPQGDYIRGATWAVLLTGIVALWGTKVRFRGPLLIVWSAKVVIAQTVMLLYDYIYGVDPDGYYGNASDPGFQWAGFHVGDGTTNMHQLVWLHVHWLSRSFSACRLTFALIGLVSVFLVYRAAVAILGREDRWIFYVLAFTPSVLFWSTILGKDPISLFSVSGYIYGVAIWRKQGRHVGIAWIAIGAVVAMHLRAWLGPILLAPLILLLALEARTVLAKAVFACLAILALAYGPYLIQQLTGAEVGTSQAMLIRANELSQSFGEIGGSSEAPPEISSFSDLAAFAPIGMFTVLFRPLPGEIRNLFGTLAGLENLCLLLLAVRALARLRPPDLRDSFLVWGISSLLIWSAVYSVYSYQNLGSASRYRLEITPLLVGTLLYAGRRRDGLRTVQRPEPARSLEPLRPHWNSE